MALGQAQLYIKYIIIQVNFHPQMLLTHYLWDSILNILLTVHVNSVNLDNKQHSRINPQVIQCMFPSLHKAGLQSSPNMDAAMSKTDLLAYPWKSPMFLDHVVD
jgi:hypothetical protein